MQVVFLLFFPPMKSVVNFSTLKILLVFLVVLLLLLFGVFGEEGLREAKEGSGDNTVQENLLQNRACSIIFCICVAM